MLETNEGLFALKILANSTVEEHLDYYFFNKLCKIAPELNNILLFFKKNYLIPFDFVISKFVEGEALSTILYEDRNFEVIAQNMINFYRNFKQVKVSGYGNSDANFTGPHRLWKQALECHISKIEKRSPEFNRFTEKKYTKLLKETIHLVDKPFQATLFPSDFNLNNFIFTPSSQIVIIESEYYFIGDPQLPLGALWSHIFGTKLETAYLKLINNDNLKALYFYAILEIASIWSYNFMVGEPDPELLTPFGNKNTFANIIESFSVNLES